MSSGDIARVQANIQELQNDRTDLPSSLLCDDDRLHAVSAMLLRTANLWHEWLFALGENDPTRHEIGKEYSQDERVLYAPTMPQLSQEVLLEMKTTEDVLSRLGISLDDPYLKAIADRRRKIESALSP